MAKIWLFLFGLAGVAAAADAMPAGYCRHAAFVRLADGEWRTIRTARGADGALATTDQPFKARQPKPGVIEFTNAADTLFLRMTQTETGYRYEEPRGNGALQAGTVRVVSCSAPDTNGYQSIVEVGTEAGGDASAPDRVDDTLTVIVAGPDAITMTGSLRPRGSAAPYRWATTMTILRTR